MDGVIIVDKPKEYTSHDVVGVLRKVLNTKKVGHTGTLDPNATGVLPILVGQATKISKYLIEHDKIYIATLKLGEKTDTGDGEGNVIEKKDVGTINCTQIEQILQSFVGKQKQMPPIYSAIKVDGKKLYEYAREGKKVDIKPREIEIYNIKLIKTIYEQNINEIIFEVSCSKGTYIRVLCENIAEKLETVGYMKELRRISVGTESDDKNTLFKIEDAIKLEDIKQTPELAKRKAITIEAIFAKNKQIELNKTKLGLLLNGVKLTLELEDGIYRIYNEEAFIGLGVIKNKLLKRDIIICT